MVSPSLAREKLVLLARSVPAKLLGGRAGSTRHPAMSADRSRCCVQVGLPAGGPCQRGGGLTGPSAAPINPPTAPNLLPDCPPAATARTEQRQQRQRQQRPAAALADLHLRLLQRAGRCSPSRGITSHQPEKTQKVSASERWRPKTGSATPSSHGGMIRCDYGGREGNISLLRNILTGTHFGVINQRLCPPICSRQRCPHTRQLSAFILPATEGFPSQSSSLTNTFSPIYSRPPHRRRVWSVVFSQLFTGQKTGRPYLHPICWEGAAFQARRTITGSGKTA